MNEPKLFDKPMTELCENFVRARFAQDDVFGRADIEEWLEQQRSAERPLASTSHEIDSTWEHFPPRGQNKTRGYGLDNYATPTIPQGQLDNDPFYDVAKYGKAGLALMKFNGSLFLGGSTAILRTDPTYQESWATAFTIDWNGKSLCLTEADADPDKFTMAIQDVLFAEWTYHRPKWEKARELLCASAEARIKEQRAKAEADFNKAVAVSADGTKIVCADYVVVISGWEHDPIFTKFPAESFRVNKVLLSGTLERISHDKSTQEKQQLKSLLSDIKTSANTTLRHIFTAPYHTSANNGRQILFKFSSDSPVHTLLAVSNTFCPSVGTKGGVEMK